MSTPRCETCGGHQSGSCCNCGYNGEVTRHGVTRAELEVVNEERKRLRALLTIIKDFVGDDTLNTLADWKRGLAERDRLREALSKINEIRNSIVGTQTMNWSEHIYPLVAALNAAGCVGMPYDEARPYFGSLIDRAVKAEDERDAERKRADENFASYERVKALYSALAAQAGKEMPGG